MSDTPIIDPLDRLAPLSLRSREVVLKCSGKQKLVVPCDAPATPATWYLAPQTTIPIIPEFSSGNEVAYFIDGPDTLAEFGRAIATANGPGHFIYLTGWWADDGITHHSVTVYLLQWLVTTPWYVLLPIFAPTASGKLTTSGFPIFAGNNLYSLLLAAANLKVQIRAMIWHQPAPLGDMSSVVGDINGLPNNAGGAILDNRTRDFTSHHQKVLIVNGSQGLIGFVGGVDVNPDRVLGPDPPLSPGSPLHDVHARIRGSAVADLLQLFQERWTDHPDSKPIDTAKGVLLPAAPGPAAEGHQYVQIVKTYGNLSKQPQVSKKSILPGAPTYAFAPTGLQSSRRLALKALGAAKKFIYIEDQYFFNLEAAATIAGIIPQLEHVTLLLTWPAYLLPGMADKRDLCISAIRAAGGNKLRVCFLTPEQGGHTYVHSKTTIVDDQFAIIGSTNYNRRGWTNDSEVAAGILDNNDQFDATFNFARRLRIRLWAEHLGMQTDRGYAELADGVASAVHWTAPPAGARVTCYDESNPAVSSTSALQAGGQLYASNPLYQVFSMAEPIAAAYIENKASGINTLAELGAASVWDTVLDPDGTN